MKRLLSLDFFRGLTIAGMIIVNDPGSWSHVYAPLRHAEWHGATPCLLYTSPSPRDRQKSRMPSSA